MMSVSMSMTISMTIGVSLLAYLSSSLVWNLLANLFWDWVAFFYWDFKWHLSGDLGADFPWHISAGGWTWNYSGGVNTMGFGDRDALWCLNLTWDWD